MKQCDSNIDCDRCFASGVTLKGVRREERGNLLNSALLDLGRMQWNGKGEEVDSSVDNPGCWWVSIRCIPVSRAV